VIRSKHQVGAKKFQEGTSIPPLPATFRAYG